MRPPTRGAPALGHLANDPDAFEQFYRQHLHVVRLAIARRVSDPHVAADLTADVFVRVIERAHTYDSRLGPPSAWLVGIARNVVAMHARGAARELAALRKVDGRALLDEDSAERIAQRIDAQAAARALYRSLTDLPAGQRAVVELIAVDGLSPTEAAQVLGLTATTVRVRFHRARRALKDALPHLHNYLEVTP